MHLNSAPTQPQATCIEAMQENSLSYTGSPLTSSSLFRDFDRNANDLESIYWTPCAPSLDLQLGLDFSRTDWNFEYAKLSQRDSLTSRDNSLDLMWICSDNSRTPKGQLQSQRQIYAINEDLDTINEGTFRLPIAPSDTQSPLSDDLTTHTLSDLLSNSTAPPASAGLTRHLDSLINQNIASSASTSDALEYPRLCASLSSFDILSATPCRSRKLASPTPDYNKAHWTPDFHLERYPNSCSLNASSELPTSCLSVDSRRHELRTPQHGLSAPGARRPDSEDTGSHSFPSTPSAGQIPFKDIHRIRSFDRDTTPDDSTLDPTSSSDSSEFWVTSNDLRQRNPGLLPFLSAALADDSDIADDPVYTAHPSSTSLAPLVDSDWTFDEQIVILLLSARLNRCRKDSESHMKRCMPTTNRLTAVRLAFGATRLAVIRLAATLSDRSVSVAKNCLLKTSRCARS